MQILGGPKPQREWDRGRIVDEAVQGGARATVFEPRERTRIELHELTHGRDPLAPRPMPRGAPATRGGPAQGQAQAPHGGATDGQGVPLLQLFGQVHVVEAVIGGGHERDDLGPHLRGEPAGRGLAAPAVQQAAQALAAHPRLQPLELPDRQLQGARALGVGDLARHGRLDQAGPRHFLPAHREGLHSGGTLSRNG